jgi:hypothetical protein
MHNNDAAADFRCGRFEFARLIHRRRKLWINEHAENRSARHDLAD